jgi:hypothetical protein
MSCGYLRRPRTCLGFRELLENMVLDIQPTLILGMNFVLPGAFGKQRAAFIKQDNLIGRKNTHPMIGKLKEAWSVKFTLSQSETIN